MSFFGKIAESMGLPVKYSPSAAVVTDSQKDFLKATEATFQSGAGIDPDEHLWQQYSAVGGLARRQNLPSITQQQMIRLAYHFYRSNPLAKRSVEITAQYAIGEGIKFQAENPSVQEILNRHWGDSVNNWPIFQYERCRDLGLLGELCIPVFLNSENGHVQLGSIDPDLIEAIVEDSENPFKSYAVILKRLPKENIRRAYKVIDIADVDMSNPNYGRLVGLPLTEDEKTEFGFPYMKGEKVDATRFSTRLSAEWAGSCFFFKVNSPISANRGYSDLLADLDWLDAHDQFLFSQVEKAIESANYVWDITLENYSEQQIMDWMIKQRKHKPGLRVAHNQNVSYNVLNPNLHLEDATALGNSVKNNILSGVGLPPIWFAESMTSRASAPEQTEPAYKSIKLRQRYLAFIIARIFQYCIDEAARKGRLRLDNRLSGGNQRRSESFFIQLPDVSAKDQRNLAITINNISQALERGMNNGYIDEERARGIFNRFIDQTAIDTWETEPYSTLGTEPSDNVGGVGDVFSRMAKEGIQSGMEVRKGDSTLYFFTRNKESWRKIESIENEVSVRKESKESIPVNGKVSR